MDARNGGGRCEWVVGRVRMFKLSWGLQGREGERECMTELATSMDLKAKYPARRRLVYKASNRMNQRTMAECKAKQKGNEGVFDSHPKIKQLCGNLRRW
jgi:hypothetical protein